MRMIMSEDWRQRQRAKNRALFAVLAGVALLFFLMTLVKLGAF